MSKQPGFKHSLSVQVLLLHWLPTSTEGVYDPRAVGFLFSSFIARRRRSHSRSAARFWHDARSTPRIIQQRLPGNSDNE
jgi:hypothetical protein